MVVPPSVMASAKMDARPSLLHKPLAPTPLIGNTPCLQVRITSGQALPELPCPYAHPLPLSSMDFISRCYSAIITAAH